MVSDCREFTPKAYIEASPADKRELLRNSAGIDLLANLLSPAGESALGETGACAYENIIVQEAFADYPVDTQGFYEAMTDFLGMRQADDDMRMHPVIRTAALRFLLASVRSDQRNPKGGSFWIVPVSTEPEAELLEGRERVLRPLIGVLLAEYTEGTSIESRCLSVKVLREIGHILRNQERNFYDASNMKAIVTELDAGVRTHIRQEGTSYSEDAEALFALLALGLDDEEWDALWNSFRSRLEATPSALRLILRVHSECTDGEKNELPFPARAKTVIGLTSAVGLFLTIDGEKCKSEKDDTIEELKASQAETESTTEDIFLDMHTMSPRTQRLMQLHEESKYVLSQTFIAEAIEYGRYLGKTQGGDMYAQLVKEDLDMWIKFFLGGGPWRFNR